MAVGMRLIFLCHFLVLLKLKRDSAGRWSLPFQSFPVRLHAMKRIEINQIAGYLKDLEAELAAGELRANNEAVLRICGN